MLSKSQVKYIQSLIEKKFRNAEGVFVAEGPKIINELLGSATCEAVALYVLPGNGSLPGRRVAYRLHQSFELQKISFLSTANQVVGIFRQPAVDEAPDFANRLTLVLNGIQDPGNFGTIVRIADWFGIRYIIASNDSADVFNPKVVQSTMGSIGRVQVIYRAPLEVLDANPAIPVFAATLQGSPLTGYGKIPEGFLLIGNESRGVQAALLAASDRNRSVYPPMGRRNR